jgi:type III restriction enzyme
MFVLRQYQQKAVSDLLENIYVLINKGVRRKKLIFKAPTGSGKTVTMAAFLNTLAQELPQQTNLKYHNFAFIWIAPNELHIQSYLKIKSFFEQIRTIRCLQFDDITDESLNKNDLLFLNWQSISSDKNLFVKENEQNRNLYQYVENSRLNGVEIIAILDEAHLFASKGQKANRVLAGLNSLVEIDVSATPLFTSDFSVTVRRDQVVSAGMIKKGVILNTGLDDLHKQEVSLNEVLLDEALAQRERIASAYKNEGVEINPLLLIQLPSETMKESVHDLNIRSLVLSVLTQRKVTIENNKLAIWLSDEKYNLKGLEEDSNLTEVLLFKQAISLGWDCPRAAVLLIYREIKQETFTVQTVGRILRMPEQKHYYNEILNTGFVYTNLSRDIITIVADDMDYLVQNKAARKEGYQPLFLPSHHFNKRPIRNRLNSKFRKFLKESAEQQFGISLEFTSSDSPTIMNQTLLSKNLIDIDVQNIEIEIPKDVYLEGDDLGQVFLDEKNRQKFARTMDEVLLIFAKFVRDNLGGFAKVDSAPVLEHSLMELFEEYFEINEYRAKKIILHAHNRHKFEAMIKVALENYSDSIKKALQTATLDVVTYSWDVPEFRIYGNDYSRVPSFLSIHQPLYLYERGEKLFADSDAEFAFIEFLEKHNSNIEWWYKNGSETKADFSIYYQNRYNVPSLFYVDFVIQFKSGITGLFDTKTRDSDPEMMNKQNALAQYITDQKKNGRRLTGGIIVPDSDNWRYPKGLIISAKDISGWEVFFPEKII